MKSKILKFCFILILLPSLFSVSKNGYSYFRLTSNFEPTKEFTGDKIYDPYKKGKKTWKKIALHLHSNEVSFSVLRHTPKEIYQGYHKNGYHGIVITDYMKVTDISKLQGWNLSGYEWGCNPKKKHFLTIGTDTIVPEHFPWFSSLENVQWSINELKKTGAFLVLNHPALNYAYTEDSIKNLSGFNAVEAISVFGYYTSYYDSLLSAGRPVFAMSTDDLHYFSDSVMDQIDSSPWKNFIEKSLRAGKENGEALKRYILVNIDTVNPTSIKEALCKGDYISVGKLHAEMPEPVVEDIGLLDGKKVFARLKRPDKIQVFGKNNRLLLETLDKTYIEYEITEKEPFVRLEIYSWGNLVLSNPFFRYNHLNELPNCEKKL
ncbi:MAG: hypothetical protein SFU98_07775 [Leptospiraceae bacterium]|nr:hypothetical protein [Leptospiraceae bacterium]